MTFVKTRSEVPQLPTAGKWGHILTFDITPPESVRITTVAAIVRSLTSWAIVSFANMHSGDAKMRISKECRNDCSTIFCIPATQSFIQGPAPAAIFSCVIALIVEAQCVPRGTVAPIAV